MKSELNKKGFVIAENVYSEKEIEEIIQLIEFENNAEEFGIREFLLNKPILSRKIFSKNLRSLISELSPTCKKSIKSIYFDKPPSANWIVNWHQDLTINLANRIEVQGYKNWREKEGRVVVQPNQRYLESIFTIRIHLDDCTKENGALRVIESSHTRGEIRIDEWLKKKEGTERLCAVGKGGVLIMKPLLLHASRRTENQKKRRVIHLEFTDQELPLGLEWKECIYF